jgi:hypothetical protein
MTRLQNEGDGRYSKLKQEEWRDLANKTCIAWRRISRLPFEDLRPKPSLSTTSSAHCMRLFSAGAPRNTNVGYWLCAVCVMVVEDVRDDEP